MDTSQSFSVQIPVEHEGSELPLGFRFAPTDEQLLLYYLLPKIKSEQMPSNYIMDLNVFLFDPLNLPLSEFNYAVNKEGYFFTMAKRKQWLDQNTFRFTPNGYWESYKENIPIYGEDEIIIGFKDKYSFYDGKCLYANKTDWKMVEYRCSPNLVPSTSDDIESYIVCKVMQKKEKEKSDIVEELSEEED